SCKTISTEIGLRKPSSGAITLEMGTAELSISFSKTAATDNGFKPPSSWGAPSSLEAQGSGDETLSSDPDGASRVGLAVLSLFWGGHSGAGTFSSEKVGTSSARFAALSLSSSVQGIGAGTFSSATGLAVLSSGVQGIG